MELILKSVLFFFGLGKNPLNTNVATDEESLANDWKNIGNDIKKAIGYYETRK